MGRASMTGSFLDFMWHTPESCIGLVSARKYPLDTNTEADHAKGLLVRMRLAPACGRDHFGKHRRHVVAARRVHRDSPGVRRIRVDGVRRGVVAAFHVR